MKIDEIKREQTVASADFPDEPLRVISVDHDENMVRVTCRDRATLDDEIDPGDLVPWKGD